MDETVALKENRWEQPTISMGMADFNPKYDFTVDEVVRHADRLMYDNKKSRKGLKDSNV